MMIVLGSAFRNSVSSGHVAEYMVRAAALRDFCLSTGFGKIRISAVEGDSTDDTRSKLVVLAALHQLQLTLGTCNHGGPHFGSIESEARFIALSKVGNVIFDSVLSSDDVLVYIESDLRWSAPTIVELVKLALRQPNGFDIFSPFVMAGELFYDTWAFRDLDGRRLSPTIHLKKDLPPLLELNSVGSCLVMRRSVAQKVRIQNNMCLVGWCEEARLQGFRIAAVPTLTVRQL